MAPFPLQVLHLSPEIHFYTATNRWQNNSTTSITIKNCFSTGVHFSPPLTEEQGILSAPRVKTFPGSACEICTEVDFKTKVVNTARSVPLNYCFLPQRYYSTLS